MNPLPFIMRLVCKLLTQVPSTFGIPTSDFGLRNRWPQKRVLERNSWKVLRAMPGPVPGKRGVLAGVLEAVPFTVLPRRAALLPALHPALPFLPALVPALLAALSRNSSPAPVSVANGFVNFLSEGGPRRSR